MLELASFGNEPRGGGLDLALQPLEERLLVKPRRDRVEEFDHDGARAARTNERRRQNRPELSATGTQGTPITS